MENEDLFVLSGGGKNLVKVKKKDLDSYTIPNSITAIGKRAFKDCASLQEVYIPNNVKHIGIEAFMDCTSLFVLKISDGVTTIGKGAFRNCTSLREVYLPDSLREIGNDAFMNCPSLRRIKIPEGVSRIGRSCFSDCKSLDTVVLPKSLLLLGSLCFKGCNNLKKVFLRTSDSRLLTIEENIISRNNYIERVLYINKLILNDYKNLTIANCFNEIRVEHNPELTDWSFSEKRFLYIAKEKIEERGIPGLIILNMAGTPDLPTINHYLCSKIEAIESSSEYNKIMAIYENSWNIPEIRKRGWSSYMISRFAGEPDLDLNSEAIHDIIEGMTNWLTHAHLLFYLKSKILQIEKSKEFKQEIEFRDNCFTRWDLYDRGWHDCLIDRFSPNIHDEVDYYEKSRIISIEKDEQFQKCLKLINNSWTKEELIDQGWSNYLIRRLLSTPDLQIKDDAFYSKNRVEEVKRSQKYRIIIETGYQEMLKLCELGKMDLTDFLDEISFAIPVIDKEKLINDACESFNDEIDSNYYYDDLWYGEVDYVYPDDDINRVATTCLNYLRHKHTPYDVIRRKLKHIYYDDYDDYHYILKRKVNDAIRKAYPWINKYC